MTRPSGAGSGGNSAGAADRGRKNPDINETAGLWVHGFPMKGMPMTDIDWPRRAGLSGALDEAAIVAITDRAGQILYCNQKFVDVSGYSRADGACHVREEHSTFGWILERMISEAGFTLLERTHDGVYATYLAEAPG